MVAGNSRSVVLGLWLYEGDPSVLLASLREALTARAWRT
jgi:hypothetical protein